VESRSDLFITTLVYVTPHL